MASHVVAGHGDPVQLVVVRCVGVNQIRQGQSDYLCTVILFLRPCLSILPGCPKEHRCHANGAANSSALSFHQQLGSLTSCW